MSEEGIPPLPPNSVIGILGGGQLGRMTALAAANLGYRSHIFVPEADAPATQVADGHTNAAYDDLSALDAFAGAIDIATYEFENIPIGSVRHLLQAVPVRPGPKVLAASQDRLVEKSFLNGIDVPTAPYREVLGITDLQRAVADIGTPAILKTARFGYDGKGQVPIREDSDLPACYREMGANRGILEGWIDFDCEISVVTARAADGTQASYDVSENLHGDHILVQSRVPARISPQLQERARELAERIAVALELVGLIAVEMFVTKDGALLVNEIAPRPHNSGHWTMDACAVSQFEQVVRAICGLPLADPARHADVVMRNLIGDEVDCWPAVLSEPNAHLHLYGKREARPGRKMGHVNRLWPLAKMPLEEA